VSKQHRFRRDSGHAAIRRPPTNTNTTTARAGIGGAPGLAGHAGQDGRDEAVKVTECDMVDPADERSGGEQRNGGLYPLVTHVVSHLGYYFCEQPYPIK